MNFPLYFPTLLEYLLMYCIYIYQLILIRYFKFCCFYHDCIDRWMLLARKLLSKGFFIINLKSSLPKFYGYHYDLVSSYIISFTNEHECIPFFVIKIRPCPYLWLILRFVTRVTWRASIVEEELFTLLGHFRSHPVFWGIRIAQSLVFL